MGGEATGLPLFEDTLAVASSSVVGFSVPLGLEEGGFCFSDFSASSSTALAFDETGVYYSDFSTEFSTVPPLTGSTSCSSLTVD